MICLFCFMDLKGEWGRVWLSLRASQMQAEKARALEFSEMMQREHQKLLTEQQQFFATKQQNAEVISDMQNQLTEMQSEHLRLGGVIVSL